MKEKVAQLKETAGLNIEKAESLQELEEIRVKLLGKKRGIDRDFKGNEKSYS